MDCGLNTTANSALARRLSRRLAVADIQFWIGPNCVDSDGQFHMSVFSHCVGSAVVVRDGVGADPVLVARRVDLKVTLIKMRAAIQRRPPKREGLSKSLRREVGYAS